MTVPKPHTLHEVEAHPWEEVTGMFRRKLVSGERVMFARLQLDRGCSVPMHSHDNEQLSYVIQGRLRFLIGESEQEVIVESGQLLQLPSWLPHSAEALEDTEGIDIFSPPRADWLDGSDDYLRR